MLKPTLEQEEVIKASHSNQMLKVNSCAGSGKTSTLVMLANSHLEDSLYIAFNKGIAQEAANKFPSHVACRTTHSLAFAKFGKDLMHKLSRPTGGYVNVAGTAAEIAKSFRISAIISPETISDGTPDVKENSVGFLVKDTVRRYEQSADENISRKHVPSKNVKDLCDKRPWLKADTIITQVLGYAQKLWEKRIDVHSNVLATHDTYLKLFQLSKPKLNYDVIYLDEAQDTGDTVLDIVMNQPHAKIILVGDEAQSIYQWRGAVNAMEKVECPTRYLTKSFRYGQDIADVATNILDGLMNIKGNEAIDSKVVEEHELQGTFTKLYRTNGALIADAIGYLQEGLEVSCEVNTNDVKKLLNSVVALEKGDAKNVKHDDVVPYGTWEEFEEAGKDDPQIKNLVKLVYTGHIYTILRYLPEMKVKEDPDVTLITAHRSKGREWDNVVLANDFPMPNSEGILPEQERNLLYVAATRAVKNLVVNDCYKMMVGE